jgi:regulatory protein
MTGRQSSFRRGPGSNRGPRGRSGASSDGTDEGPDGATGVLGDEMSDPESVARGICLRALTGAPKTRQQLAELLAGRGVPDDAAESVLDRFTEVGLIDDAAFARAWVSSRQAGRGLARRALSAELRAKGVDSEVAAEAVEAVDDDDEREAARRLVERKAGAMRRLDRATAMRRLMGMLARKGYSGGMAAAVIRDVLDGAESEDLETSYDDEDALLP